MFKLIDKLLNIILYKHKYFYWMSTKYFIKW